MASASQIGRNQEYAIRANFILQNRSNGVMQEMETQAEQMKAIVDQLEVIVGGNRHDKQKGKTSQVKYPHIESRNALAAPERKIRRLIPTKLKTEDQQLVTGVDDSEFNDF
jgi:hypothetical protein